MTIENHPSLKVHSTFTATSNGVPLGIIEQQVWAEQENLEDAVRMIATLGGFLGRKGDGEPGVKTIWLGLRRLHDITATWQLLHSDSPI